MMLVAFPTDGRRLPRRIRGTAPVVARTDLLEAADSELLALARTGESEAFGVLYERHVAAARQLAYQLAATPRPLTTWWQKPSDGCRM